MRLPRHQIFIALLFGVFFFQAFEKSSLFAKNTESPEINAFVVNQEECGLFVDIGAACLVPCDSTEIFVRYENLEDVPVADAYVEITLDTAISMGESDLAFSDLGGNRFRFDLGTLAIGEVGVISFTAFVDCDAEVGQVHVIEAHAYPDDLCPPDPNWDGSEVEVEIDCQGDSIYFNLENVGDGDMGDPSQLFIIEDNVVVMLQGYQLLSGEKVTIVLPNNGGGYHFEAGQTAGNPFGSFDNISTGGCENITVGFVEQFSEADLNLAIDVYNRACSASCSGGATKLAFPEGYGAQNIIAANLPIEYQFNFENLGPDTITEVTICDTLSPFLDISTVLSGASSHDYVTLFPGGNVVKFVFDDIELLPGEMGFVKTHLCQAVDNPPGTLIPNVATTFFDGDSVLTNEVFHTIPPLLTTTVVDTTICGDSLYFGIPISEDVTFNITNDFSIFTSQLTVNVTYFEGTEDETMIAEICEGESVEINGVEYTDEGIYEIPMIDPDGCPYTLTLILTVIENNEVLLFLETCQPDTIDFFGQALDQSGVYSHVEANAAGCFDIFILNLTILPSFENTTEAVICAGDTLIWGGQIFTEATTTSVAYSSVDGCDSIETLVLEVAPLESDSVAVTICEGESFFIGNTPFSATGLYEETISSFFGCDSTVFLNLAVLAAFDSAFSVTILEGEVFEFNGEILSETGDYNFVFPLANGCDSVITVLLDVVPSDSTCFANAGTDTLICGFSTHLIGTPETGTWETLCPGAPGFVAMSNVNDSTASVTVSECGTYFFRYTLFRVDSLMVFDTMLMDSILLLDTCLASDVVQVDFEDPSKRVTTVDIDLDLGYNNYDCHEDGLSTCSNIFSYDLTEPAAKWEFGLTGECFSEIYTTSVDSLLGDCLVSEIDVTALTFQEEFDLAPLCIPQDSFIVLGGDTVVSNNLLGFLGQLSWLALDSLNCPPPPSGCFSPVECEPDTLGSDTILLEVPVRIGGHWLWWLDPLTSEVLSDTTELNIGGIDYALIIDPNSQTYSPVNFEIWEIIAPDTLTLPSQTVSITLSWEEIWVLDTIEVVTHDFGPLPSDCCVRGDLLGVLYGAMPGIPVFDCPSFTITFESNELMTTENVICDSASYVLELTISGGTPPYAVEGLSGMMTAVNVFVSDPIPMLEGYEVTVTDSSGCEVMLFGEPCPCLSVNAISPPTAEIPCDSTCVELTGAGSGSVPWSSKWQAPGGVEVSGTSMLACEPGTYLFIVFDSISACADTSTTEVSKAYIEALASAANQLDCVNASTQLSGNALPDVMDVIFLWEGSDIQPGEANSQNPTVDLPGWYFLSVTDTVSGCEDTDSVLIIQSLEMPTANIESPSTLTCEDDFVSLFGNGSSPFGQISFEWTTATGNIIGSTNNPNIIVNAPSEYTLTVTHLGSGCTSQSSVTVMGDFTPPANVNAGDDDQLDCDTDELNLDGSAENADFTFAWTTLDGNILSGENTLNPLVDSVGTYVLTVTNPENGCSSTDEVEVSLDTVPPTIQFAEADTLDCVLTEIELNGQLPADPAFIFQWETQAGNIPSGNNEAIAEVDAPGWYFLTVTDITNACEVTDSIEIFEDENAPEALAGFNTRFSCETAILTLDGTASAMGADISYLWSALSGNVLTNSTSTEPQVDEPGEYLLTVTDEANGCTGVDTVEIFPYIPVSFSLENTPDCFGSEVAEIAVGAVEGYAAPYSFSINGNPEQAESLFKNLSAGTYEVSVIDTNGCVETQTVEIVDVPVLPEFEFADEYHFCGAENPLELSVETGLSSEWVSYFWSNGNDNSTITITEAGEYEVEILTACQGQIFEFEAVDDLYLSSLFQMPNVFTPNGDGLNDTFGPVTPNMPESFELLVFDRWGNKVFQSTQPNQVWDGKRNGKAAASDVYVWTIFTTYEDCEGTPVTFDLKGDVTLLR